MSDESKYGDVRYYSSSKKELIKVENIHSSHLINIWRKETKAREAGEQQLPEGLWQAIEAEIKARELDKPYENPPKY